MRRYRFRALVKLDPASYDGGAMGSPSRTGVLTVHACCLLQPFSYRGYLPAVISRDEGLPSIQPGGHAVVTIALAEDEAEVYFARGQGFAIWADGVVDHTIRAEGLLGYGVISGPESPPSTCDDGGRRGSRPARRSAALVSNLAGHGACGYGS